MRLGALLPRAVLIAVAWILATAAFTLAADKTNIIGPQPVATPTRPAALPNLTVPDVTGQAFVFAKGLLEDSGFAWRVSGSVHGYAGNQVAGQSPAAGTQVVDTGAPTVVVTLVKGRYGEQGVPRTPRVTAAGDQVAFQGRSGCQATREGQARRRKGEASRTKGAGQARRSSQAAGCLPPARRAEGAARPHFPPRTRREACGLDRDKAEAEQRERPRVALPARLDRHGRGVRLVARSLRLSRR